jgi:hypothetical protein
VTEKADATSPEQTSVFGKAFLERSRSGFVNARVEQDRGFVRG